MTETRVVAHRSMLFVPATRPDMVAKTVRYAPDLVVVDLEDAVGPDDKDAARSGIADALSGVDFGPIRVLVRVNAADSPWFQADLDAVADSPADGVVLPKYERPEQVSAIRDQLGAGPIVVGGLESALGVAHAETLLREAVDLAYFGAEDYIADIGGERTVNGTEVLYARSQVVLAAFLGGVSALDQVVVTLGDDELFRADAVAARQLGYTGKMCIHPRQVTLSNEVFTPTPEQLAHARSVLAAARSGVAVVDGQMVDAVHERMARRTLARAGEEPR